MSVAWQFVCILLFGASCWTAGDLLCRRWFFQKHALPGLARPILAFTAGNVAFSYILTILGIARLFTPAALWTLLIAGSLLSVIHVFRLQQSKSFSTSEEALPFGPGSTAGGGSSERADDTLPFVLLAGIIGLFLLPSILQAAAPPYVRDALVYHLLCPKEYLKAQELVILPGNLYSAFPKGHEVLMTLLLAVGGDRAAQGFSLLQYLGAVGGLWTLCRMRVGPWSSLICTLGFATLPPVLYFTGCGYVEPALLMTFGSCLLALALFQNVSKTGRLPEGNRLCAVAFIGFIAGWMTSLKYNGLIYLGLIGLVLLWNEKGTPAKEALRLCLALLLASAPGFFWMIRNWIMLGNPVYPLAWFLFGGEGWDQRRAIDFSGYFELFGMGRGFVDTLLLPWRFAFLGKFDSLAFDGAAGPFLLLFGGLAVFAHFPVIRRRAARFHRTGIGLMLLASSAFFVFGTQQARFWLPSQMLLCLFAAPAVQCLTDHRRVRQGWLKAGIGLVLVASLAWNLASLGKQMLRADYVRTVLGSETERSFLRRKVPGYPAIEFMNRALPDASLVLSVWTGAYGYYFEKPYYSDTFIEDVMLKKWMGHSADGQELARNLAAAGFTHLFVRHTILVRNLGPKELALLSDFIARGASELYRHQDFYVFQVGKQ